MSCLLESVDFEYFDTKKTRSRDINLKASCMYALLGIFLCLCISIVLKAILKSVHAKHISKHTISGGA